MMERQRKKCRIEVGFQLFLNRLKKKGFLTKRAIKYFQDKINVYGKNNFKEIAGEKKLTKKEIDLMYNDGKSIFKKSKISGEKESK